MLVAIFPLVFLGAFLLALKKLLNKEPDGVLVFIIFALPIYLTSLSVSFLFGYAALVPAMQVLKEVLVLIALVVCVWKLRQRFKPDGTDWLLILYVLYAFLYIWIPSSNYSVTERALAFKGISFFPVLYFIGRLIDHRSINLKKWLYYICIVTVAAGATVLIEALTDRHLQLSTGYADYNFYFFNVAPAGNYDLTWTFESGSGHKRFASFYSMPLEHAAATLVSFSALFALSLQRWGKYTLPPFLQLTLVATLLSIVFALSRAAFAGYFIMLYVYAVAARKKGWLRAIHGTIIAGILCWLVWVRGDIMTWVMETVQFTDTSSLSHLLEWIDGIQAMSSNPFGLGLGASGRVSGALGENIGGENQLIIIGVQLGIAALLLYALLYFKIIIVAIKAFRHGPPKEARLGLMLFLSKVGLIIPLLTSELESYIYISYLIWFFSGLLINMQQHKKEHAAAVAPGY